MGLVDHPQPNTTVARLHFSLELAIKPDVIQQIKHRAREVEAFPTGATVIDGEGLWFPEDESKHEVEKNLIIEIWIDSREELEAVRDFKTELEDMWDQECVCLSLEDRYYEH